LEVLIGAGLGRRVNGTRSPACALKLLAELARFVDHHFTGMLNDLSKA
jgi:hypothetical protein